MRRLVRTTLGCCAGLAISGVPAVGLFVGTASLCAGSVLAQDLPVIETVDDLLNGLETADKAIERVSTPVVLAKDFALAGDREARTGELVYRRVDEPSRTLKQFNIRFTRTITGTRVEDNIREYIFDGEWLVEKFVNERQFIKRQMVAPGQNWDPLRLGEGPFPVPIGQRKADILREYVASLANDPAEGIDHPRLREQASGTHQLVLDPRPELMDSAEFERVRIWYDQRTLLPKMIIAVNFAGDITTVVLQDVLTNEDAQITADAFDTTPPPIGAGWDVSIEPWRGRADPGAMGEGAARIEGQVKVQEGRGGSR